ncbi:U4/U6 small nuclear ribonucleoprotein Prp31-like [Thalassophryne amazonica]|uniref:U4/U6 small nuclear ribonucleoprotein Prp31-like n=1 Tax=Thalassophryne amazonica TaxID=390379 RepID=UPI001470E626|nr:U4/U6 small nuclear ribonucleoprotein Prp31-like [Thalassophryne amazonica]
MVLQIEDDAYQEDLGFSLGQLGKSGSGRVRQAQVNEATKARISKSLKRTLQKQSMTSGASPPSETAPREPAPVWPSLLYRGWRL